MFRFFTSFFAFIAFFIFFAKLPANNSYITLPAKGWECIQDPSQLPQKVKIIFIGSSSGKNGFAPSVNVAAETTQLPLHEYILVAKKYHESQAGARCHLLGKIKTEAGEAELLQIDRPSQWGEVRFLQAMLIVNKEAYVVTATCLKNDFGLYSTPFFKAIQSLKIDSLR